MKLILALPAAGLLFSGAVSLEKMPQLSHSTPQKTLEKPTIKPTMWTDNALIYKGETLQIHFETPHASYLGVIDPNGNFFYVVFPSENSVGELKPLVDGNKFSTLKTLIINTSTLEADPYTYGVLKNKPVFTKSGMYRFLLGDNLHVDDESALTILKVEYKNTARPHPNGLIAAI